MNLRRAALITAISLGLVRAHWIASQAIALIHAFELAGLASLLTNTAFPLPVLFVAIYRMHPQLDLTKNLRTPR
ncbi:MAG TPA: hypothetical protein VHA14_17520 [Bryobacteraceae bacterium]|nr:hypothetical protein [Bryobacteraceae bacterium]